MDMEKEKLNEILDELQDVQEYLHNDMEAIINDESMSEIEQLNKKVEHSIRTIQNCIAS